MHIYSYSSWASLATQFKTDAYDFAYSFQLLNLFMILFTISGHMAERCIYFPNSLTFHVTKWWTHLEFTWFEVHRIHWLRIWLLSAHQLPPLPNFHPSQLGISYMSHIQFAPPNCYVLGLGFSEDGYWCIIGSSIGKAYRSSLFGPPLYIGTWPQRTNTAH